MGKIKLPPPVLRINQNKLTLKYKILAVKSVVQWYCNCK